MASSRKVSIVPVLWSRKNKDGMFPLKVRVTINRKSKYYPLGVFIKKTDWSEFRKLVKSSHPEFNKINFNLQNLLEQLETKYQNSESDEKDTTIVNSLSDYIRKQISQKSKGNKFYTSKRYNTLLQHLIAYWGNDNIYFYDLNADFVLEFRYFLETNIESRGLDGKPSMNTVNNYLKALSALINKAIDDGVFNGKTPFKKGHVPDKKRSSKITLNRDEMWFLGNLNESMEGMNKGIWDAKNLFLFSFWSQGIRVGDALQLKYGSFSDGYFEIVMEKTKGKHRFPLTENNVIYLMDYIPGVPPFYDWVEKLFVSTNLKEGKDEHFKAFGEIPYPLPKEIELLGGYTMFQGDRMALYRVLKGQLPIINQRMRQEDRVRTYFDDNLELYSSEFYQKMKERANPIDLHYFNALEESTRLYRRLCMSFFVEFAQNPKNKDTFIFPYLRGLESDRTNKRWNKISSSTALINKNLRKISERYQIRKFSTHYARHTFTSLSKEMGVDIYDLKQWLGHSSVKVTEGYINTVDSGGSQSHSERMKGYLEGS